MAWSLLYQYIVCIFMSFTDSTVAMAWSSLLCHLQTTAVAMAWSL